MTEELLYELKKDINTPGRYWRAGIRKTEKEWKQLFDIHKDFPMDFVSEWFIDLRPENERPKDLIQELVSRIFDKHGLHSISYKEAACECVREALTRFNTNI